MLHIIFETCCVLALFGPPIRGHENISLTLSVSDGLRLITDQA